VSKRGGRWMGVNGERKLEEDRETDDIYAMEKRRGPTTPRLA